MVVHHDRRHRREVLLVEVGVLLVPAFLAGLRVERDEVVVRRDEVQVVLPETDTAVGDRRAALGLPEVVPQLAAITGVHRPRVVGRGHVERAVDHQRRALDVGWHGRQAVGAGAADDDRRATAAEATAAPASTGAGRQPGGPGQREALDRGAVHLRQRAVALARVIAGVRRPVLAERFGQARRVDRRRGRRGRRRALARQHDRQREKRQCQQQAVRAHFSVTR